MRQRTISCRATPRSRASRSVRSISGASRGRRTSAMRSDMARADVRPSLPRSPAQPGLSIRLLAGRSLAADQLRYVYPFELLADGVGRLLADRFELVVQGAVALGAGHLGANPAIVGRLDHL